MYDEMLQRLLEGRARAWGELQKFHKEAETRALDKGSDRLLAEDQQEWDRRSADLDDYDTRIKQVEDRAASDRQADEYRAGAEAFLRPENRQAQPDDDPWTKQEKAISDFFTASAEDIRSQRTPNSIEVSFRGLDANNFEGGKRVIRESRSLTSPLESRTGLVDGTTTAGGFTFGPSFRTVLYQHLIFNSAIRQTRATILTTGSGENILLPKTVTHPQQSGGTITPEAVAINESDPVFGQGTLSAYKYANLINVSTELEQDTQVDLLGYLAMAMGRALGNTSGKDFITGTGSSQPFGVIAAAGTIAQVAGGTPAASGATFAELTQLYDKIIPGYQVNGEWLMSQPAMQKIRALSNSQGTPIFLPSLYGQSPNTLFGHPIVLDPNVPAPGTGATSLAFGDFASYFIRDVGGVRFERSIDFHFDTDQVAYRAIIRTDGQLLDLTGAIGVYKGGTA